jgi:hypothetical protein
LCGPLGDDVVVVVVVVVGFVVECTHVEDDGVIAKVEER